MTSMTLQAIEAYADEFETQANTAGRRVPRPHRKSPLRFVKRQRRVQLGMKGRNRSRSAMQTLH